MSDLKVLNNLVAELGKIDTGIARHKECVAQLLVERDKIQKDIVVEASKGGTNLAKQPVKAKSSANIKASEVVNERYVAGRPMREFGAKVLELLEKAQGSMCSSDLREALGLSGNQWFKFQFHYLSNHKGIDIDRSNTSLLWFKLKK